MRRCIRTRNVSSKHRAVREGRVFILKEEADVETHLCTQERRRHRRRKKSNRQRNDDTTERKAKQKRRKAISAARYKELLYRICLFVKQRSTQDAVPQTLAESEREDEHKMLARVDSKNSTNSGHEREKSVQKKKRAEDTSKETL
jgi:hypothetical protein